MSSSEKTVSVRELIMSERAAFIEGLNAKPVLGDPWSGAAAEAARRYPLPRVWRPRVVSCDNVWEYRAMNGQLEVRRKHLPTEGGWQPSTSIEPTPRMIELFADLFANPTEEVEL